MATSEVASKILAALNSNEHGPGRVGIPHDQDIHVGPYTFRYGGGSHQDRWFLVDPSHPCQTENGPIRHDFQQEPDNAAWSKCSRAGCGLRLLTSSLR
jgi:hypothetical protein